MDNNLKIYFFMRNWFDWAFENPEIITPTHGMIMMFAIDLNNRLGWKEKFGFPSMNCMEAIGVKDYKAYKSRLDDLVKWGFIKVITESKNQYSSCIIALVESSKATTKALDKANLEHTPKHTQSTHQDKPHIDKQDTSNQLTNIQETSITSNEVITDVVPTYGNQEINTLLISVKQVIGIDDFTESSRVQRQRALNLLQLGKKIGKEDFEIRLRGILQDDFKAQNCNSIAYLYKQMKAFIHSPIVETEGKGVKTWSA